MLNCRACLWRCIQALDTSSSSTLRVRRDAPAALNYNQQRFLRTTSPRNVAQSARPARLDKLPRSRDDNWKESDRAAGLKKRERLTLTQQDRPTSNHPLDEAEAQPRKLGRRDPSVSIKDWNRRRKELQYLADPLELANFVKNELLKDKATEMLQLVKMASHSMQCIVSWNHLIDYYLAKGSVSRALAIYNDMKKRAQFPDSYTYTILLRGMALNAHHSGTLGKALSVYHSLSAPNSRVEPTIIHTNAALTVCSRALDMDALWGVAAKIPENGPASANGRTYGIILNAIRQNVLVNVPAGETEEQVAMRRDAAVLEGRRVWHDVTTKWRSANLVIEEELVCSMGRLLLVGARPQDWDDVLSLVEQTMDVPRLVPRLGTAARSEAGYPTLRAPHVIEQFRKDEQAERGEEFLPIAVEGGRSSLSSSLQFATPSNNTLSMIQEACQKIVAGKAANEYWDLLTDPTTYAIHPDVNNLNSRLRLLRQNRASAKVVEIIRNEYLAKGLRPHPGTFRLAMSTCVRDKNNHNSLSHANEILEIMTEIMEDVDPKSVQKYAELVLSFPLATGKDMIDSIVRLNPVVSNIKIQLGVGAAAKGDVPGVFILKGPAREDAFLALRKIYAIMDKIILSDMISEEQKRPLKKERARLGSYLQRVIFKNLHEGKYGSKTKLNDESKNLPTTRQGEEVASTS